MNNDIIKQNDIINGLLGRRIEVRDQSAGAGGYRDEGILVAYDERWVQLQKDNGEILFFPIANIRLLKPLN